MGWINLENKNGEVIGIVGDEPWDIMGEAIDKIKRLYNNIEGRDPNAHEMLQIYEFVGGILPIEHDAISTDDLLKMDMIREHAESLERIPSMGVTPKLYIDDVRFLLKLIYETTKTINS